MREPLVDVHAHICDPAFDDDRVEVLARARKVGVAAIVAVGENLDDARKNMELAKAHPILKAAAGLYPTILDPDRADEMIAYIRRNREHLVAIGEVGLDYWVVKEGSGKEVQREICQKAAPLLSSGRNGQPRSGPGSQRTQRTGQPVRFHPGDCPD